MYDSLVKDHAKAPLSSSSTEYVHIKESKSK